MVRDERRPLGETSACDVLYSRWGTMRWRGDIADTAASRSDAETGDSIGFV